MLRSLFIVFGIFMLFPWVAYANKQLAQARAQRLEKLEMQRKVDYFARGEFKKRELEKIQKAAEGQRQRRERWQQKQELARVDFVSRRRFVSEEEMLAREQEHFEKHVLRHKAQYERTRAEYVQVRDLVNSFMSHGHKLDESIEYGIHPPRDGSEAQP